MATFKLLVLSLAISYCFALKAEDICSVGSKTELASIKCEGKYWNQCGSDHCSVDKDSCKVIQIFFLIFNLFFLIFFLRLSTVFTLILLF